ncbi:Abi family protein [Dietzia massiliensis]|uniref:Abi family protein n=1 Tax=Dietzia massiliensis TaxID=2697499 RepID=UPI001BCFFDBC|nr:Abi family protein [Dietzia massiliensis]MBS7548793.1 Abi family protein [Dietzia massiliensis]
MTSASNWAFYERHFAPARLQHYLARAQGDHVMAMELYRWNVAISGAFWQSFAYFEVAFRNALDARLAERHLALGRSGHWVFDDFRELGRDGNGVDKHRQPYKDIAESIGRVRRNRKPLNPGQIISELPFGFWHQMVSRRHMFLWPDIAGAFPHAPTRDQSTIQDPVKRLRELRNRIGHHHRVWSEDVQARYGDLLSVAGCIDPALAEFINKRSQVPGLLRWEI